MLAKFDSLYLKKSTALQIVSRRRLESIRLDESADPSKFFNDFERAVNDLKTAGAEVTSDEKANHLIRALPESFAYLGDLVDVLPKDENVVEYLKSKIIVKAKTNGNGNDNGSASSDSSVNSQVFAANCGNKGGKNLSTMNCFKCGQEGHRRFECPGFSGNELSRPGGQNRGSRGNFRGRGFWRPNYKNRAGHGGGRGSSSYQQNSQQNNQFGNCFVAEVNVSCTD